MQLKCDATFVKHFQVIKLALYLGKTHKVDDQDMMVGELLIVNDIDSQQGMFKLWSQLQCVWHLLLTWIP